MEETTLLKLFKEFAGGTVNLFGLKCIPVKLEIHGSTYTTGKLHYQIHFVIENPNNVSYIGPIVYEELLELVDGFGRYLNIKVEPRILWEDSTSKFYLNTEIKNKIEKVFNSVKEIKFTTGTPFIGYKKYTIEIESIGLQSLSYDNEAYYIENKVRVLSATKNNEPTDVIDAIKEYIDGYLIHKETYYETEEYYSEIDSIITKYPLLNADYVATYYDTKFIQ